MSKADTEEIGGEAAKDKKDNDSDKDNLDSVSSDEEGIEDSTVKQRESEGKIIADDPTVILDDDDDDDNEEKEKEPDPEEPEQGDAENTTDEVERQLLAVDEEADGDGEEGEVGTEELGLLGNLEDETEEGEVDALGGNPLDNDQEDGEILDEDEAETQFIAAENVDDKTTDIFLDDQEQEQEHEQSISAMEVDLDAETSQEADESQSTQNPLGTTITEGDEDDEDAVTIVSDGVEGTNPVTENDLPETQKIIGDISEVNPADFLVPKDGDKIGGGGGDAGDDDAKNDDKEEGELDDTENDGESVDTDKKNDITKSTETKKDKGNEDSKSDDGIIEIDKEGEGDEKKESDDEEGAMPMIRMNSSIFEAQEEDDDEGDNSMNESSMDPDMIQNMMEFEMDEGEGDGSNILQGILKKKKSTSTEEPVRRVLPRRAAAQAAANTIKEISNLELNDPPDNDPEYVGSSGTSVSHGSSVSAATDSGDRHRCHHCKKMASSLIVVRQYGTDIHLCSNSCFNSFRNPDPTKRPLPCAKCGILNRDTENATVMYWETMNFCSDLCVGNFQLEIGSKCSTCVKRVAWQSLGKYCVRFGSDIRQFCSALCLESYKKNARVCFHCQLDIKRLGNVVMANIPMKATPKEFCGQDCVEMYIEQNLQQPSRLKAIPTVTCCICSAYKPLDRELVISPSVYQICGEKCWQQLLESQSIRKATKCETCPKYINMEYIKPAFYVATEKKAYGFCSATCKNVFVLKHRQILSCTNCKVKKYNYDLIQSVTGPVVNFAVCSLNCLPKPSQYITTLKETLNPPLTASDILSRSSDGSSPVINSVTSMSTNQNGSGDDLPIQISSVSSLAEVSSIGLERSDLTNGGGTFRFNDTSAGSLTLRQANEDDIIEIRDEDIISIRGPHENGVGYDDDIVEEEVGVVAINDDRWIRSDISITYGKPPAKVANKGTSARPLLITKEVQSDSDELWAMPRVDMKAPTVEKIIYVPVPIPYPVFLPCPFSFFDKPVPMPWPVGVPIPIPIPVDTKLLNKSDTEEGAAALVLPSPSPAPEEPAVTAAIVPSSPTTAPEEPAVTAEVTEATDEIENMEVDEKNDDEDES